MRRWNNYRRVCIEGLNIERSINNLTDANVSIYNIVREAYNKVYLTINDRDIHRLEEEFRTARIEYIGRYGIISAFVSMIHRVGILIGIIISITLYAIASAFTLHINIVGIESINRLDVLNAISDYGISIGKINTYDKKGLEDYILKAVDGVSMVSIQSIGTTLLVNIKEESSSVEEDISCYISPYNMVINDYRVYSGISNISVGKIVKKGDVLIYPDEYTDEDGVLHLVAPKGYISATIWHTATDECYKEEIIYTRTGKSTASYTYYLGDRAVYTKDVQTAYETYDVYTRDVVVSSFILPIRYTETVYYETEEKVVQNDFNKCKEKIIANLISMVYNDMDDTETMVDEIVDIVELDDRYIINVYLECIKDINI
ncbi:MAG: hypothetical protein E7361_01125 [Clostridiales bacterium]|nr:hypothetical protein [Clostridiales bacterium]